VLDADASIIVKSSLETSHFDHSQNEIDESSALNVEDISGELEALYRKHRDSLSLSTLLSLRLDGSSAEE